MREKVGGVDIIKKIDSVRLLLLQSDVSRRLFSKTQLDNRNLKSDLHKKWYKLSLSRFFRVKKNLDSVIIGKKKIIHIYWYIINCLVTAMQ